MKQVLISSAMAVLLGLGVAGPATAASEPIQATAPAASTSSAHDDAVLEKLNALKGKQTAKQIKAIVTSPEPAELLYDPVAKEWLAGYYITEPSFSTQAISVRGPGCATTDACATTTSNLNYGYYGTGRLDTTVNNTRRIASGDRPTSWLYASDSIYLAANKYANLVNTININGIARY